MKLKIRIATNVAHALSYMHGKVSGFIYSHNEELKPPMAHLDVKTPNLVLCSECITDGEQPVFVILNNCSFSQIVKLIDFGCSQPIITPVLNFSVENPLWAAPEIIAARPLTEKVSLLFVLLMCQADVYSFALVCWELLTQALPFAECSFFTEVAIAVCEGKRPRIPSKCPVGFRDIITSCWVLEILVVKLTFPRHKNLKGDLFSLQFQLD